MTGGARARAGVAARTPPPCERPLRHHRRLRQPLARRRRPRQERRQDDRRQRAHGQLPAALRPHLARPRRRAHRPPHRPRQAEHRAARRHARRDDAGLARALALRDGGARGAARSTRRWAASSSASAGGDGAVEVSGPTTLAELRVTVERLQALGADQVIVDGAINRIGSASPRVSDGVVVATGGMVGDTLDDVLETTVGAIDLLTLPGVGPETRKLVEEHAAAGSRAVAFTAGGVGAPARARDRRRRGRHGRPRGRAAGRRHAARRRRPHAGVRRRLHARAAAAHGAPRHRARRHRARAAAGHGRPLPAPGHPPRGAHAAARARAHGQPVPRAAAVPAQGLLLRGRRSSRRPRPDVRRRERVRPAAGGQRRGSATSVSS